MPADLTEAQRRVLEALSCEGEDWGYLYFSTLAEETGMDRKLVRRITRALARKGLAEYGRGLWTEDGEPAGSGYCITPAGRAALAVEGSDG